MPTARTITPAEGWGSVLAYMDRGTILVLGGPGTGKTTLARWLLGQLDRGLDRVALIDCDPDNAHIGVPGCLGLALTGPWQAPAAQWFVGAPEPVSRTLQTVTGVVRLAERARQRGAQAVLLDTSGRVDGAEARRLKVQLAQATGADQMVALERQHELSPLLALLAAEGRETRRIGVSGMAREKTPEEQRGHRESRFAAHFQAAKTRLFSPRRIFRPDWTVAKKDDLSEGLVVGLLDGEGFCLGLGKVDAIHADRVEVLTPVADVPVVRIQIGGVRLGEDYREIDAGARVDAGTSDASPR